MFFSILIMPESTFPSYSSVLLVVTKYDSLSFTAGFLKGIDPRDTFVLVSCFAGGQK